MARISINRFGCPVCLDLLKDPVTICCRRWDQEDVKGVYRCPQCRETFTPRPVLRRNNMLVEMVQKLKNNELQAASPAHCYTGPGDVECDFCTVTKHKAIKSCLVCLASYCEDHLKPHYQSAAFKRHKLVEAGAELQEKICSQHGKLNEIYCHTDQSFICSLCMMDQHKGHDTVAAEAKTTEKQSFLSLSFDGVRKSLSDLKKQVKEISAEVQMILPSGRKSREDFMQYFCYLTLDPNTAHRRLILSEKNRAVTVSETEQRYANHPERFDSWAQVLCKESVCGRCYWEVEWSGHVFKAVSYKEISRKGGGQECLFGCNGQSWSLQCSYDSFYFWHNNIETSLRGPASSRIGVFVDHSAGTLSFYSVSDTMRLLHRVHTTFTQPLYAGFRMDYNSPVRLCDPK